MVMGHLHPAESLVCKIDSPMVITHNPDLSAVKYGENLIPTEKSKLQAMLRRYEDVFAADSKKPTLTTITEHRIITENALPVRHKTRRLPKAWEQDINEQIKDMLEKEIIRPSVALEFFFTISKKER